MFARKVSAFSLAYRLRQGRMAPMMYSGFAAFSVAALAASDASAAGGVAKLKTPEAQEVSGAWHLFVTIELPKAPLTAHVPMRFVFTKTAVYERSLTDNSKDPVLNKVSLSGQQPTSESLDVDFANPQGQIFKGTNFDFGLPRSHGYEAGEYTLQIRTADGVDIGGSLRLVLKGDNPVVDRRAITFEAKKSGITKVGEDAGAVAKNTDTPAANYSGDVAPSGSAAPFVPQSAYQPTDEEKIKENPKGCGCSVPGLSTAPAGLSLLGALGAIVALARRRRRSSK